jgi:hypothetical protein
MNLSNQNLQLGQGMFVSSATQLHPLGTRGYDPQGRAYRYVRAGATDLVAGNVIQSAASVAGHLTLAVNTTSGGTSPGSVSISVTCASAVSTGFYNEGLLIVASGSGAGGIYTINQCPAVSTGATGAFTLYAEDAIPTLANMTISTSSKISLIPNPYQNVIQAPVTTATNVAVGVAVYVITATQFGWIQTWGPCAVISDDTTATGAPLNAVAGTAGRASGFTAASLLTGQAIGNLIAAGVAGEWRPIFLKIAP